MQKQTYREKREKRAERLRDWGEKQEKRAEEGEKTFDDIHEHIPLGQPILNGHHSEKRHRRDLSRADNALQRSAEASKKAKKHNSRADTIEAQLNKSIYDDDPDAIEALVARIEDLESRRERIKKINAWFRRKAKASGLSVRDWEYSRNTNEEKARKAGDIFTEAFHTNCELEISDEEKKEILSGYKWNGVLGFPSYALQNLGGNIRRNQKRLEKLRSKQ